VPAALDVLPRVTTLRCGAVELPVEGDQHQPALRWDFFCHTVDRGHQCSPELRAGNSYCDFYQCKQQAATGKLAAAVGRPLSRASQANNRVQRLKPTSTTAIDIRAIEVLIAVAEFTEEFPTRY